MTAAVRPASSVVIDDGLWLTLPYEGRRGNAPAWPLSKPEKPTPKSRRELEIWRRLWKLPEATGWDRAGSQFQVAMHVRSLVRAEDADAPIGLYNVIRLQQAELGLTPGGKKTLHWRVGHPPIAHAAPAPTEAAAEQKPVGPVSPKNRLLRVVPDAVG